MQRHAEVSDLLNTTTSVKEDTSSVAALAFGNILHTMKNANPVCKELEECGIE
jgi:hypothetical protein